MVTVDREAHRLIKIHHYLIICGLVDCDI